MSYRSAVLSLPGLLLTAVGVALAETGAREVLVVVVLSSALLVAAGLTILRDPSDIANHVRWGHSNVGQGRSAGVFCGAVLALFGAGLFVYAVVGAASAFAE